MGPRHVWILNLDAELEWGGASPDPSILDRVPGVAADAARALVPEGDVWLDGTTPVPEGARGRAWCPTPGVADRWKALGIDPVEAPSVDVVRRANDRRTWAEHGLVADDSRLVLEPTGWEAHEAAVAPGTRWRLKRPFTVAGRGHRRVTIGGLHAADRTWIERSLAWGGMVVEPERTVLREGALHGYLHRDGSCRWGAPVRTRLEHGAWCGAQPADDLSDLDASRLRARAETVAGRLHRLGYFGPFGIDAMHVEDGFGGERYLPGTEVNARYTLSWSASGLPSVPAFEAESRRRGPA